MANIIFNNKNYTVDDSFLSTHSADLKQHLSTIMNGTGDVIYLDGIAYNIDSVKLAAAKNAFISHLGTIAGNGHKVVIGGVEYGIDGGKVASAIAGFGSVLEGSQSDGDEENKELESAPESYLFSSIYELPDNPTVFDVVNAANAFGASSINVSSLSSFLIPNEDEFASDDYYEMIATLAYLHQSVMADYAYTYFKKPTSTLTYEERYALCDVLSSDAIDTIRSAVINLGSICRFTVEFSTDAEGYPVYYYSMRY